MIGKFTFVWKFTQVEDGRAASAMVAQAAEMGLGMVALKIADGAATAGASGSDVQMAFYASELRKRGIQVWGWQYLYGGRSAVRDQSGRVIGYTENSYSTPEREAAVAIARMQKFGLDGYIADPEAEYKTAPAGRAEHFMRRLRAGLGDDTPLALCSYRFPNLHRELDWAAFLAYSDYHMPQVYWGEGPKGDGLTADGRFLAVLDLEASYAQLTALAPLPFLPVGRAYIGDGHANPRPAEITAFLDRAHRFGFEGAGFWSWDCLRPSYPGSGPRAQAIGAYAWPGAAAPPPAPEPEPPEEPAVEEKTVYRAVYVRRQPSLSAAVAGTLQPGTKVRVLETVRAQGYIWARHALGWSAVYQIGTEWMG